MNSLGSASLNSIRRLAQYFLIASAAAAAIALPIAAARAGNSISFFPPEKWAAPMANENLCREQYSDLMVDVVAKGQSIGQARETKASATAICRLLTVYDDAERRLLSFVETNSTICGFPNGAGDKIKSNRAKTTSLRQRICGLPDLPWLPNARWRF